MVSLNELAKEREKSRSISPQHFSEASGGLVEQVSMDYFRGAPSLFYDRNLVSDNLRASMALPGGLKSFGPFRAKPFKVDKHQKKHKEL